MRAWVQEVQKAMKAGIDISLGPGNDLVHDRRVLNGQEDGAVETRLLHRARYEGHAHAFRNEIEDSLLKVCLEANLGRETAGLAMSDDRVVEARSSAARCDDEWRVLQFRDGDLALMGEGMSLWQRRA
ncbi:hypothetical protein AUC70_06025 [Methyloceanibacter stevinii]|uniref:Uncharacterized protein n=1 Tax=Methyloceanibacter stevinii TaxID=1774970 RepID=A0A1E3VNX6_9HYPH|nr:hypothetical protein AUC70_06025 [Methyloceanibacter stevinii]